MVDTISIEGLDAVVGRLDRLPSAVQEQVFQAVDDVAERQALRIRVGAARAGRQARAAARSVRAEPGGAIVGGGPFFMGAVFGGQGRPSTSQFKPYKPAAYWFFPALRQGQQAALAQFEGALERALRSV